MRVYQKAIILYSALFLSSAVIFMLIRTHQSLGKSPFVLAFAFLPIVVFSWLAPRILRCPHCGKDAATLPNGVGWPWVGDKCRHCGQSY